MARAVLQIIGDASSVQAAFGAARAASRGASAAIAGDSQRAMRAQERAAQQAARATEREAQNALRAQMKAYQQASSAARLSGRAREAAERNASEIASREARARGLSAQQEGELRRRALNELTRQYVAAEQRMTAAARRETAERVRLNRESERTYRRGLSTGLGGARGIASGALSAGREIQGEMQSARARRATTEHTLNSALYQAHIYGPEGADAQRRVMEYARSRGMDPQAVAEGIAAVQGRFSVLAGGSAQERRANLDQQLSLAEFAQNTYQSPTEVMLAAGALGEQGVTGSAQMEMLRAMTGTAQAGSVELSTVISTGLGPMMQNIARSVNSNMTADQRSAAVRHAVAQSMAEAEIGAAAGLTPRDSLNALAKMRTSLTSDRTAANLRGRLRGAGSQGQAALAALYDANGSLNTRDPIEFMSRLSTAFGGDTSRVMNLLSAGGPGSPMVLDAQQRRLIGAMASQTSNGGTIADSVNRMMAQGASFSQADVEAGRSMVQGEQGTQLQRDENARMEALTGNTRAIQSLSNNIASFQARNPITGAIAGAAGLGGVAAAARSPTALAGTLLAGGTFASLGAIATGTDVSGRRLGLGERIARGAALPLGLIPGVGGALGAATTAGMGVNDAIRGAAGGGLTHGLASAVDRLTQLLQSGGVRATVDPHDAAHAAAEASTTPARR